MTTGVFRENWSSSVGFPPASSIAALLRPRRRAAASYLHGWRHWRGVAAVGQVLVSRTAGADLGIVLLFALLHDCERQNDDEDPGHGERAARLVEGHARELGLSRSGKDLLAFACRWHAGGETSNEPTIGACFDADRLTLWRVGIEPHDRFLSTDVARTPEMKRFGERVSEQPPLWIESFARIRRR